MDTVEKQTQTTEACFGRALRYAEGIYAQRHKRGFQARISERVGVPTSNLSQIAKRDRGAGEDTRRKILKACTALVPELAGMSYDMFLDFGKLLLSGMSEDAALEQVRAARYSLHIPRISGQAYTTTGSGCIVQVAGREEGGTRDELRAELERWIAEDFPAMSLSAKCATRDAMMRHVPGFADFVARQEKAATTKEGV